MKRAQKIILLVFLLPAVALSACSSKSGGSSAPGSTPAGKTTPNILQWPSPPPMTIEQGRQYIATIKTNLGDIEVQLFP